MRVAAARAEARREGRIHVGRAAVRVSDHDGRVEEREQRARAEAHFATSTMPASSRPARMRSASKGPMLVDREQLPERRAAIDHREHEARVRGQVDAGDLAERHAAASGCGRDPRSARDSASRAGCAAGRRSLRARSSRDRAPRPSDTDRARLRSRRRAAAAAHRGPASRRRGLAARSPSRPGLRPRASLLSRQLVLLVILHDLLDLFVGERARSRSR